MDTHSSKKLFFLIASMALGAAAGYWFGYSFISPLGKDGNWGVLLVGFMILPLTIGVGILAFAWLAERLRRWNESVTAILLGAGLLGLIYLVS